MPTLLRPSVDAFRGAAGFALGGPLVASTADGWAGWSGVATVDALSGLALAARSGVDDGEMGG